jgi:hypothetical protein
MARDRVIDPSGPFRASIAMINRIPETFPMTTSMLFEVPSGAGSVTSAPYWKPMGPALRRKNPNTKEDASSSQ